MIFDDEINSHRSMLDQKDQVLAEVDRYVLLRQLGRGAFGAVYLARDTEAGILVALKTLPPELVHSSKEMQAVRENFALVSKLKHPHIASNDHLHKVQSVKNLQAGIFLQEADYLLVMEYVEGSTLSSWKRPFSGKKVPLDQVINICRQLAQALDYAHSQGIIHRDIKPGNIIINSRGQVKLLDFGLAAEIRSSMSRLSKDNNSSSGTCAYMPPEQLLGERQDHRSDQYALAVLVYEMLCGEIPFQGVFESGDMQLILELIPKQAISDLAKLDKKRNAILRKGLAKEKSGRFESCSQFIENFALAKSFKGERNRSNFGMIIATSLLLIITVAIFALSGNEEQHEAMNKVSKTEAYIPVVENAVVNNSPDLIAQDKIISWNKQDIVLGTIHFKAIPQGRFFMGSNEGSSDEKPVHEVTLSKPFWMGKYEVTQQQWQTMMQSNPSRFRGINLPVERVSWNESKLFVEKLNSTYAKQLPQAYQFALPTEAQWEYACRAGTSLADIKSIKGMGWWKSNSSKKTHPVGRKKANAWGLCDMYGNVWELCRGKYGNYPAKAVTDPVGSSFGLSAVARGGSWAFTAIHSHSTNRRAYGVGARSDRMGLRLVLVPQVILKSEDERSKDK